MAPADVTGRNWGEARVEDAAALTFGMDAAAPAFALPLASLAAAKLGGKHDVVAEFAVDDTVADKDQLVDMTFYVPPTSTKWEAAAGGEGEDAQPASALLAKITASAQALGAGFGGSSDTGTAVASFDDVAVIVPRGRFRVDLYPTYFRLSGPSSEFKVMYKNLVRIFVLPKSNAPQTLVAVSLDSPIRKGQTFYQHVLVNFSNDEEVDLDLAMTDDALKALVDKGHKIERALSGDTMEVFCKALRGISGATTSV